MRNRRFHHRTGPADCRNKEDGHLSQNAYTVFEFSALDEVAEKAIGVASAGDELTNLVCRDRSECRRVAAFLNASRWFLSSHQQVVQYRLWPSHCFIPARSS